MTLGSQRVVKGEECPRRMCDRLKLSSRLVHSQVSVSISYISCVRFSFTCCTAVSVRYSDRCNGDVPVNGDAPVDDDGMSQARARRQYRHVQKAPER
jgi:hypothetical protein